MFKRTLVLGLLVAALVSCAGLQPVQPGTGLKAEYFSTIDLTGPALVQTDPTVNFDWGSNAPRAGIPVTGWSIRLSGQVLAPYSEEYTFYVTVDDGVRLYVNDQLVISQWQEQSATEYSAKVTLEGGRRYNLRMEFYENQGVASAKLEWSSPTIARQVIPQAYLYPAP